MKKFIQLMVIILVQASWMSCTKTGEIADMTNISSRKVILSDARSKLIIPAKESEGRYVFDARILKVTLNLGLSVAGIGKRDGAEVNLELNRDTINKILPGLGNNYMELDPKYIKLPTAVQVQSNTDGALLPVEVDLSHFADFNGKTLVFAIAIKSSSAYTVSSDMAVRLIQIDYLALLENASFVEDFSSLENTKKYATVIGFPSYESGANNFYNDINWVKRSTFSAVQFIYDIAKYRAVVPYATAYSGMRINALGTSSSDLYGQMSFAASIDHAKTFQPVQNVHVDLHDVPGLGANYWKDMVYQAELPAGTTHLKLELLDITGLGKAEWIPLLRRLELFYNEGKPYQYVKPN